MQNNLQIIVTRAHLSALTVTMLIGTVVMNTVTQLPRDLSKWISILKLEKKIRAANFATSVLKWE